MRILRTTLLVGVHAVFWSKVHHQLSKATDHCITLCYRLWVGLIFAVLSCELQTISLSLGDTSNELISYTKQLLCNSMRCIYGISVGVKLGHLELTFFITKLKNLNGYFLIEQSLYSKSLTAILGSITNLENPHNMRLDLPKPGIMAQELKSIL